MYFVGRFYARVYIRVDRLRYKYKNITIRILYIPLKKNILRIYQREDDDIAEPRSNDFRDKRILFFSFLIYQA